MPLCPPACFRAILVFILFCVLGWSRGVAADGDAHPRLSAVDAQIEETREVLGAAETDEERETFENRLQLLQQEREILVRRIELRKREEELSRQFTQNPKFQLTDTVQRLNVNPEKDEEQLREIKSRIRRKLLERSERERTVAELKKNAEADAAELSQQEAELDLLEEELRALRLWEAQFQFNLRLIQQAERIDLMVQSLPVNPRPTTRGLLEKRRNVEERTKQREDVGTLLVTLNDQEAQAQASLNLSRAQQDSIDQEIEVLASKLSGFNRILQRDSMLSRARASKRILDKKIEAEEHQVNAILSSKATLRSLEDLLQTEVEFLEFDLQKYTQRYLRRILVPITSMLVIFGLYLLLSRLVLPLVYQRDELFNARRLGGYLVGISALVVISLYFFDDLQAIATVFGIAGAALVIALQDLLSAIAGWFVIVSSRKVKVGDRVEVDGFRGDIIDIQLMRTTLVEINQWLGVDQPTGRIVVIPNSFIFKSNVVNYSHMHRYLWGNIDVLITFESSMEKSKEVLRTILEEECAPILQEARSAARSMEIKYGVSDTVYEPKMYTTVEESGINFKLLYIAHYKHVSSTLSRISDRIARAFESTEGIEFAYPTIRQIPTPEKGGFPVTLDR